MVMNKMRNNEFLRSQNNNNKKQKVLNNFYDHLNGWIWFRQLMWLNEDMESSERKP